MSWLRSSITKVFFIKAVIMIRTQAPFTYLCDAWLNLPPPLILFTIYSRNGRFINNVFVPDDVAIELPEFTVNSELTKPT